MNAARDFLRFADKPHDILSQMEFKLRAPASVSVVVSSAAAAGTIATVRYLGELGYDVGVLYHSWRSAAAWSRYAKHAYLAPPEADSERFIQRLIDIGAERPGQVLLASSDETAWLYAENAARLSPHFVLYHPPVETIRRILDKSELAAAAKNVGIATPPTWDQSDGGDPAELYSKLPYPILIKPRTHVQRINNDKGVIVYSQEELVRELAGFVARENKAADYNNKDARPKPPLLQQFISSGANAVSITGFIDRSGARFVTRRCVKIFQRLTATGVGVCFEALPADDELSSAVRRLCGELGYFGIFEAEFIQMNGAWALIDFNPRLFNQLGLDIYRGMPLPLFACLDALGESGALQAAIEQSQARDQAQPAVVRDVFTLRAILLAQSLRSTSGKTERDEWKTWMKRHASHAIDFAADRRDWRPSVIHALSEVYLGFRALPRLFRLPPTASSGAGAIASKNAP